MNPIRPWRGPLIAMLFSTVVVAQDASLPAEVALAGKPGGSAAPAERVVSPKMAELLAASMPKLQPMANKPEPVASTSPPEEKPANTIVRLPRYVVAGPKLPTRMELLTKTELEHYAMEHYIGPEDGFDRGFLNLFTIAGVWKKIPVLGAFPFVTSETNEERGMRLYNAAERKRKMDELMGLMKLTKETAEKPKPEK